MFSKYARVIFLITRYSLLRRMKFQAFETSPFIKFVLFCHNRKILLPIYYTTFFNLLYITPISGSPRRLSNKKINFVYLPSGLR